MGIKYGGRAARWGALARSESSKLDHARKLPLPEVRFVKLINELEPPLCDVVRHAFFADGERFRKFASAPASARGHHSGRGGNLLHTVDVAECALLLAKQYEELVDKQVLLAAALLHDIGKAEEYENTPTGPVMSQTGEMLGHKSVGFAMTWAALQPVWATDTERALAILNAIGSATHSYDLRGPATLEAIILSKADQVSAAADLYRQSLRESGNNFAGVRHRHLAERPRHPRALPSRPDSSPPAASNTLSRVQRYPMWGEGHQ